MQEYLDLSSAAPAPRTLIDILRRDECPLSPGLRAGGRRRRAELRRTSRACGAHRRAAPFARRAPRRPRRRPDAVRQPRPVRGDPRDHGGGSRVRARSTPTIRRSAPSWSFGEAGVKGVITGSGVFQDADPTDCPLGCRRPLRRRRTPPELTRDPHCSPADSRGRRLDHLHLRVHRRPEGCRGHASVGGRFRRRGGATVPAVRAARAG